MRLFTSQPRTRWDNRPPLQRWFEPKERDKWATRSGLGPPAADVGLPTLDARMQRLYGTDLPRGVLAPRLTPDRPPVNHWMRPHELLRHRYVSGQIILGKFADSFIGHLDDRPLVTIAGARAGKTSTVLEPNLYLYPGSCIVLDPKGELSGRTAALRRALGHKVYVLAPFGEESASFNPLDELDAARDTIVDDVAGIAQAIIVGDEDSRSKHWNDSARMLLQGIILLTLLLPAPDRNLVSVRQLLTLSHPRLVNAASSSLPPEEDQLDAEFFTANRKRVEVLLGAMAKIEQRFGGALSSIGNRFLSTPLTERGSIFSTAAAQTDFLASMPLQAISLRSDFSLATLRGDRPTTIYLCLPVGRTASHFRWLRMIVQLACLALEQMGPYPREQPPILFMMEEFATLGHMEIMERAAAYFPGFGVKLWAVLQDVTQLQRYYAHSAETFLGNAGLIQCFANGDATTLEIIGHRLAKLIEPFELRQVFARERFAQLLLMEGEAPAACGRLEHTDVAAIRAEAVRVTRGLQ
ncbi:MAG TPA: type IV secretory system conjugative DNA transfer family protein [Xanthobacteraceae bacterium]|jgi:type IV secretion system protein VirD4